MCVFSMLTSDTVGLVVRRCLRAPVGRRRRRSMPSSSSSCDELDPGVHGGGAVLVGDHVLAPSGHHGGPGRGQHPDGDLVGHDARGHEQRGRLADPRREGLLERPHRRILAVVVVADLGLGHGAAHRRRGPGDGVAAQVDHVGHAVRLTARR